MKIFVKAKPNAKEERIEQTSDSRFAVFIKEPSKDGKANAAIARVLAKHFGVSKSQILFISGKNGKNKIIEINFRGRII
ncbi:MAG: DUF167 domain-containing protein [Patescibacteria group bacterium]